MQVFRVFPYLESAPAGQPGHPLYQYPEQIDGRLDNRTHYLTWYLAREAAGAVGESFANLATWIDPMFEFPLIPGARKVLGTFEIDDDVPLLDLDDAAVLVDRHLRPTQVVRRNLGVTQGWALSIFNEQRPDGRPRWNGVKWWSSHHPNWDLYGAWNIAIACTKIEPLDLNHTAVVSAARSLGRNFG